MGSGRRAIPDDRPRQAGPRHISGRCSDLRRPGLATSPARATRRGAAARRRGSSRCRGRGRTRCRRGAGRRPWSTPRRSAGRRPSASPNVLPTPPGNSESPVKRCGCAVGVVVQQRDRAGGVAGDRDHLERAVADGDGVALRRPAGSTATPVCSVIASASGVAGHDGGAGRGDDVGQRAVVVPVLVGGDDRGRARRRRSAGSSVVGLGGRVDQHLVAGVAGSAAGSSCWTSPGRPRPW